MQVHVDGDVIVYRAGFAAEHTYYHVHYMVDGEQQTKVFDGAKEYKAFVESEGLGPTDYMMEPEFSVEDESLAIFNVKSIIGSIAEDLQVDLDSEIFVHLSGPENYRNGIATIKPYKGNRIDAKKPVHSAAIKQYMRSRYNCIISDGEEADDTMAIAHYALWEMDPTSSVLATIDKDLNTIPGLHYDFAKKETFFVEPEEACRFFWTQMLTGDTVDNIPGIPGVGKKKAEAFMAEHWPNILGPLRALYVQAYGEDGADAAMLEMGRLLYIRKRPNEIWQMPQEIVYEPDIH